MGKIILLNTPIGNLGDLTPRVLEALKVGTVFAVEDTRVFKELLNHLGVSLHGKRVFALHDQSDDKQMDKMVELAQMDDLYVTSDAGSPIISDPAYPLVLAATEKGIAVESYSGVSSPVMALELSGLPPIPFHFHGFLPRESGKKSKVFQEMSGGTHIYFDAPTRIEETMDLLSREHPDLKVAIVRELSKKFEQVIRLKEAREWSERKAEVTFKGEFVLLVNKALGEQNIASGELKAIAEEIVSKGAAPKQVAKLLGLILDRPTKEIYSELNRQKQSIED